ncbi:MAG: glycine C-acetyltransferase [Candidatus Micrarchaeota archaeon]
MDLNQFFSDTVDELKANELNWDPKPLQSANDAESKVEGQNRIILCANNYLGLSNHPALKKASIEATQKWGAGSGSVRAISGTMELHLQLEKKIAEFKRTQAATYYQSGFTVNSGLLPAVLTEGWISVSDELNHGSIIDGIRLSKAEKMIYKHADMQDLRTKLQEAKAKNPKGIMVVTDGVFSMDGDITPLDQIYEISRQFDANIYVDDAHGDGVLGKNGTGIVSHFHLHDKIDMEMGTFSKAFGTVGGYICGSQSLCEFAFNKSRTWLLTGSQPPGTVAASIAALDTIQQNPELVERLWKNREYWVSKLQNLGFDTGKSQTPIVPIMLGDSKLAQEFSKELFKLNVYALPIVFPMVAKDKARIRTQLSASHTKSQLDTALDAVAKVGKKLGVI